MQQILRPWTMSDLDSLVLYANNPNIAKFLTNGFPHPYTVDSGKSFLEMATKNSPVNIMAIDVDGTAIGSIGIFVQTDIMCKNAELGYWLAEPYWGKGIITKAIIEMTDYAFNNFAITRIYARPFGHNVASQKVLEKAGFKLEARFEKTIYKNNEFVDELVYAIRR